jgi:hypothetical protein
VLFCNIQWNDTPFSGQQRRTIPRRRHHDVSASLIVIPGPKIVPSRTTWKINWSGSLTRLNHGSYKQVFPKQHIVVFGIATFIVWEVMKRRPDYRLVISMRMPQ